MLLDAHTHSHMHTERQTVRMTLPFEFTALGSGRFDIGTSQNLASCSTTTNLYYTFEFVGVTELDHNCHKSRRSKMVAIIIS